MLVPVMLSGIAGIFLHVLLYLAALGVVLLAIYLFGRTNGGITDFLRTQALRRRYMRQMKQIILGAARYEDYLREIVRL